MRPKPAILDVDFDQAPFIVIWETTRACDLKCRHCRAEAVKTPSADELSSREAIALLDEIRRFGTPLVVLTGGDPIKRADIYELIAHGDRIGLRMTMTPAATDAMTPEVLVRLKESGLARLAVSLDGSTPELHDAFRGEPGTFDRTMRILAEARRIGLPTQINTTITRYNEADVPGLIALLTEIGISLWSVFFLVPTGRGRVDDEITAEGYERIFNRMYDLSRDASFDIKSTAAPQYRRVILQRKRAEGSNGAKKTTRPARADGSKVPSNADWTTGGLGFSMGDGVGRAPRSVNEGNGFVFISHTGEIYPSGFLPVSGGNVKAESLVTIYRDSDLFRTLRDFTKLKGKCKVCEFNPVCGGSRARAYGVTGDYMEADPYCAYVPPRYARAIEAGTAEPPDVYFAKRMKFRSSPNSPDAKPREVARIE